MLACFGPLRPILAILSRISVVFGVLLNTVSELWSLCEKNWNTSPKTFTGLDNAVNVRYESEADIEVPHGKT